MKERINNFLDKGYLLSPDFFNELDESFNEEEFINNLEIRTNGKKPLILNKEIKNIILNQDNIININWLEFEKSKYLLEKGKECKSYKKFLDILEYKINKEKEEEIDLDEKLEPQNNVVIINEYEENEKKREIQDFVKYFKHRYDFLKGILQGRQELSNLISINKLSYKNKGELISLIGLVVDKRETKNKNIILTIEDPTGMTKILINNKNTELYKLSKNLILDEVIGVNGSYGNNILFVRHLLFPDIPLNKEIKKSKDEDYAIFISDIHVGSTMFLHEDFQRFIDWINGKYGTDEHKEIAKKVKYLFIVGDLVDGIGIYPGQDKELVIKDIVKQYEKCAEYISQIRKDIKIIICPGNHDALRIAEPQPVLNKKFAQSLYELKNVKMVTNPSLVNINSSKDFSGFDILLYHGYSFDYYANNVDSIRMGGGYDRADLIMKFLLQKRHLAPSHGSTLYIPNAKKDYLIIDRVPDLFVTGHIHKANIGSYNNITTICCSCWQAKTTFQEKVGHNPEPSRVPIINLKTREVKMLKFCS